MTTTTVTRKIGQNRGKARLWIEGTALASQHWNRGSRFDIAFHTGSITITRNPSGARKIAGTDRRPIIDTNTAKLTTSLGIDIGSAVKIEITRDAITITKAPPGS